jgi:superfamily II DNA or RNA helicase
MHLDAGKVLHETIEENYKSIQTLDTLKEIFTKKWKLNHLDISEIKNRFDDFWLMIANCLNKNLFLTSTEFKIFFNDAVGYLDGINTTDDIIHDWKSSTRTEENEKEYYTQAMMYSWLFYRKFSRLPKQIIFHYLKYSGSKGELIINPTSEEVFKFEDWYYNILHEMEEIIRKGIIPEKCSNCFDFCAYSNLCFTNENALKFTLNLIGNYIQIEGNINPLIHKALDKKFSYELKNAFFIKKARPNAKTTVKFWNAQKRLLPIGFMKGLIKTLKDYGQYKNMVIAIDVNDMRKFNETKIIMPDKFINNVQLRDYQVSAVETFLRERIGILEMGTGAGKTEVAIELIRRLGFKTLFIVDKIELLRQTKKRIEDSLGVEVGEIGSGKSEIKDVTVATIQTLIKHLRDYSSYLQSIRFVIYDETHKVAAHSYFRISHHLLNTEYRCGISGTVFRDDGNDMMINAVAGYKCYDLSAKRLVELGWLVIPSITFIKDYMTGEEINNLEQDCKTGLINETKNYTVYYDKFITNNVTRNNIITNLVTKNKDKKILILTKLIEHGEILTALIPNSKHLYGATNKDQRKEMFKEFTEGNLNVLISTISIFAEGIDIPVLSVVINAAANRGDVKTIQVLGRVLRKMHGKKDASYIDFIDETKFFKMASYARRRALRDEGHEVETIEQ